MGTFIEHDSPQTLYAASLLAKPVELRCHGRGWSGDDPRIAERVLARLRDAGFGVTEIGCDRVLVTPGEVDVQGAWRRARIATRASCVSSHAFEERFAARRLAESREREEAARQAAERARVEAEREETAEDLRYVTF